MARVEAVVYERRRPEATTLYQVVQDNLETLYEAVDEGAVPIALHNLRWSGPVPGLQPTFAHQTTSVGGIDLGRATRTRSGRL